MLPETWLREQEEGNLLRSGLGYHECNVSACLNVSADHLGLRGIDTLEQLVEVKRIPIEIAQDAAILNADDPYCLQMADYTEAKNHDRRGLDLDRPRGVGQRG